MAGESSADDMARTCGIRNRAFAGEEITELIMVNRNCAQSVEPQARMPMRLPLGGQTAEPRKQMSRSIGVAAGCKLREESLGILIADARGKDLINILNRHQSANVFCQRIRMRTNAVAKRTRPVNHERQYHKDEEASNKSKQSNRAAYFLPQPAPTRADKEARGEARKENRASEVRTIECCGHPQGREALGGVFASK